MHQPVHPHSRPGDRPTDREEGRSGADPEPREGTADKPVGPFSGPAEQGYRPATLRNVPNPYTTRRLEIEDVDTGARAVGRWRGVGMDQPDPRDRPAPSSRPDAPVEEDGREAAGARTSDPVKDPDPPVPPARSREGVFGGSPGGAGHRPFAPASDPDAPVRDGGGAFEGPQEAAEAPPATPVATPEPHASSFPRSGGGAFEGAGDSAGTSADAGRRSASEHAGVREPYTPPAKQHGADPVEGGSRMEDQPDPYGAPEPRDTGRTTETAASGPGPAGPYEVPRAHREPADPPAPHGPYQGPAVPPVPPAHAPQGYAPQAPPAPVPPAAPPQQHGPDPYAGWSGAVPAPDQRPYADQQRPAPQPAAHYHPASYAPPHPLMTYPGAYPFPFQPPGYAFPGQPVVYQAPYGAYGPPVQHIIVLAAGQPPQVITTEPGAPVGYAREVAEPDGGTRATVPPEPEKSAAPEAVSSPEPAQELPAAEEKAAEAPVPDTAAERASGSGEGERASLLNEALAGLAMRDLSLVDSLLEMVEELETDTQDPDLLDKLFKIDNFATRMRRNGENFLVLTDHDGGESDAHDEIVPLLDVARAATSEIKDYPRVRLGKLPQTCITGLAADDISHLLAELLDNATSNSPEHSQVVVSARELDDGRLMIVVEDEGVGIPEAQIAALNQRLQGDPVLDDEVPRHLGLYVASRIARKHGLETRLESRSFRGVNAYAIIPKHLLRVVTPPMAGQSRTTAVRSVAPPASAPAPLTKGNGSQGAPTAAPRGGGDAAVTSAGLPRRSATPHGSPLRMMPPIGQSANGASEKTPPKLTGRARAEQIRDELGDFLDGEREALEGGPDGEAS
ncbi:sensor histidine kinase KdpD [Nocardiopsis sp. CNT312]|uniref:sensor histidine kinase n=1 Tax=Nocardiopsis sp. CNT312 TaxID=1137268 RepID=UPI001E3631FF|nr:sensor histidine kinase [Nocardiopsis sp. CNT312]